MSEQRRSSGLFDLLSGAGSLAGGFMVADDIRESGREGAAAMRELGDQLAEASRFRGYGVQTGMGQSTIAPDGSLNVGVGPDAGMLGQSRGLFAAGAGTLADPAAREQAIFERAMAMQNPALDRAQAAQQAREYAMGRSGIRGSQFGGTAEDAAMARARAEAANTAAFNAMQQAQTEGMNAANLGMQGLQASFIPFQQQLAALQAGGAAADRAQTGMLTGAGYQGQLGLGALQSQINADKAAADLFGNLYGAGMSAIGGLAGSGIENALEEGLVNLFTNIFDGSAPPPPGPIIPF